ncbi:hypothetical protein [Saccharothrix australiensis]|uniref:hypothetical protein n=1 Tax=Saccharothrix australiensis TaxID=2072 RepID=UPI001B880169|nr:hypothetical protein [Saccharothrix australiensis]
MPLRTPFDARDLCRRVAEQRGRPIHLVPITGTSEAHGLWLGTDTADVILYEDATALPHQEHIILHELSHLLCGHYRGADLPAGDLRVLVPTLDPKTIRRMLGRTTYVAAEEQEAELLASIIRQHAEGTRTRHPEPHAINDRLRAVFAWEQAADG